MQQKTEDIIGTKSNVAQKIWWSWLNMYLLFVVDLMVVLYLRSLRAIRIIRDVWYFFSAYYTAQIASIWFATWFLSFVHPPHT